MKEETSEFGVITYEFEGDEIIEGITKRIVYPNGRIKEYKKLSSGGYWSDYPLGKKKVSIPIKCPKCNRMMDWHDEKEFLESEQCDRCKRIETMNAN